MDHNPRLEVSEHDCIRKSDILEALAEFQSISRPILFRNFSHVFFPNLPSELGHKPDYLRGITPSNPLVTLFCQSSPGDFPQNLLQSVPFHNFLDEWDRRRLIEAQSNDCHLSMFTCAHPTTLSSVHEAHLDLTSYPDIFLGNAHLKDLSEGLQAAIGESPFETNRRLYLEHSPPNTSTHGLQMLENGRLWMGNANHVSHLHFDAHHGLLVTLFGHKRVHLYEPLTHLDIIAKSSGNHARDNPLQKSLGKDASPLVVDLYAGDALLIPLYWWHLVESVTSSIAINFWCYPDFEASKRKFGVLWSFTRRACIDHIKALLSFSPGSHNIKRSKWSLLTKSKALKIVEAILRFKLPQSTLNPTNSDFNAVENLGTRLSISEASVMEHGSEDFELYSISTWSDLVEFACSKVRAVILEENFY